jgi:hypothetical protein
MYIFSKIADLEDLDHGLEDEDETDERGENIFGELGEVFHQAGTLKKCQVFFINSESFIPHRDFTVLGQS